jgi:CRISPR/Cas system-associated endonuclease Cas1
MLSQITGLRQILLLTVLYITDQGAYLSVKNQQFQVYYQGELRIKVPVSRVSNVVLFGCCNVSHGAVSMALRRRIPIMYLSRPMIWKP